MIETSPAPAASDIDAGDRDVFVIFEGGGAKGVAHVGAMDALVDHGLNVVGAAGTSAGALAAVLTAIGLEGADVMSRKDPRDNILRRHGLTPVKLLGPDDWRRVTVLERMAAYWSRLAIFGGLAGLLLSPCNLSTLFKVYKHGGLFDTRQIRTFVNAVIRERLIQIKAEAPDQARWEVPDEVTFKEFVADRWPTVVPLKIVATNVETGKLELFDAVATPDVVVAEAVAASISIPLAFKPARIPSYPAQPGRYADGGMVSNFPTWVFTDEKLARERETARSRPIPIVGFRLRRTKPPKKLSAALDYLAKLLTAALSGSQGTASRLLDDILEVPLDTPLDTMEFDLTPERYGEAREIAAESARRHLAFHFNEKPRIVRDALEGLRRDALKAINDQRQAKGEPLVTQLRVGLILPFRGRSLRVMASVGMEDDADDRLLLDRRGEAAAGALRGRGFRIYNLATRSKPAIPYMTKYEKALLRGTVQTLACVPIFGDVEEWKLDEKDRSEPLGVLTIDTDEVVSIPLNQKDVRDSIILSSIVLYEAVHRGVDDGQEHHPSGPGAGGAHRA